MYFNGLFCCIKVAAGLKKNDATLNQPGQLVPELSSIKSDPFWSASTQLTVTAKRCSCDRGSWDEAGLM